MFRSHFYFIILWKTVSAVLEMEGKELELLKNSSYIGQNKITVAGRILLSFQFQHWNLAFKKNHTPKFDV